MPGPVREEPRARSHRRPEAFASSAQSYRPGLRQLRRAEPARPRRFRLNEPSADPLMIVMMLKEFHWRGINSFESFRCQDFPGRTKTGLSLAEAEHFGRGLVHDTE